MPVTVDTKLDVTQRELVADLAWIIYRHTGHAAPTPSEDVMYFFRSKHPSEQQALSCAEDIFEVFIGDGPSYDDDDIEEEYDE